MLHNHIQVYYIKESERIYNIILQYAHHNTKHKHEENACLLH